MRFRGDGGLVGVPSRPAVISPQTRRYYQARRAAQEAGDGGFARLATEGGTAGLRLIRPAPLACAYTEAHR